MHRSATGVKTGAHKIAFEIFCLRFAYNFRDPRFLGPAVCDWYSFGEKRTGRVSNSIFLVDFFSFLAPLQWLFRALWIHFRAWKRTPLRVKKLYWSCLQSQPFASYSPLFDFPFWELINKTAAGAHQDVLGRCFPLGEMLVLMLSSIWESLKDGRRLPNP